MSKDLPRGPRRTDDDISTSDRASASAGEVRDTQPAHPRHADLGPGGTGGHERPVCVVVLMFGAPFRELIQAPGNVTATAVHVPWRGRGGRGLARWLADCEIAQSNRDIERVFIQARRGIDDVDYKVFRRSFGSRIGRREVVGHFTVRGHSDQCDFLCFGTSRRVADGRLQVHAPGIT